MIPIERFHSNETAYVKALARARAVKPDVYFMFSDTKSQTTYFLVKRRDKISDYVVRVWLDPDGEKHVECECWLGKPPLDASTRLPMFDPAPCTHAASLVLFIEKKEGGE